jgi:hypothetical protein
LEEGDYENEEVVGSVGEVVLAVLGRDGAFVQ